MNRTRLEAFSDAVIAILITIMIIEFKLPEEPTLEALLHQWPQFSGYLLSFVYLGIYWNNHHHMLHAVSAINGSVLWANSHLLFWLSLVPFCTAWMDETHFAEIPVVVYGVALLMAGVAYYILALSLIRCSPQNARLRRAAKGMLKELSSIGLYLAAIVSGFFYPPVSLGIYALVALIWIVPDRRMEKELTKSEA